MRREVSFILLAYIGQSALFKILVSFGSIASYWPGGFNHSTQEYHKVNQQNGHTLFSTDKFLIAFFFLAVKMEC